MKLDKKKFDEFDIGAAYHQAWHEYLAEDDAPDDTKYYDRKYMPKRYGEGVIPQDVFMFIYACQKHVKDTIIKECCEE